MSTRRQARANSLLAGLLHGWRGLPPQALAARVAEIRRLAVGRILLNAGQWRAYEALRDAVRASEKREQARLLALQEAQQAALRLKKTGRLRAKPTGPKVARRHG
jgi:hypothetical protein